MFFKRKRLVSALTVLMMLLSFVFPMQTLAEENNEVIITIIGTSDLHGAINSWSYESGKDYGNIGLARLASMVKEVRNENPNTLLIDNGDTIQGSILTDDLFNNNLEEKQPMIDLMSKMGYDAMTLGNHEFNFGTELIKKMEKEASFPLLSANTYYKESGESFVKPYVVKEVSGIKVGILGLTVPSIPRWDGPKVKDLEFKHMAEEAAKYVKILKEEEKVDLIVTSAHAGLESRHETDGSDSAKLIAEKSPELDVLLLGHDHSTVNERINGVLVGAPAAKYGQAGEAVRFDIKMKKENGKWKVADKKLAQLQIQDYESDEEITESGKKYHETTLEFLKNIIGQATDDFHPAAEIKGIPEAQLRDTAVIDLINEVQLKYTGAEVAAAALFKTTSNLPKGDLNFANIFDIYKYANKLVAVEVTGKELKDYMEWSASYYNTFNEGDLTISFNPEIRGYNYDMFAGVEYKVDISKPAGERIVDLTMNGEAVKDDQIIKLAVNDYRYSGLKGKGIISGESYFNSDPKTLRAFIKEYIEEKGTIEPKVDNNWELVGYNWDENLRKIAVQAINEGILQIPTSEDGRTVNVKSIRVENLKDAGLDPDYNYITVVHTNDTHSRLSEGKYDGMGFTRLATKIDELREQRGKENVLVLDAGDTFHGKPVATVTKGESVVKVLNSIGYDVMVPGNHDFNYGQERLLELSEMTNFPIISANVTKKDGDELLTPYVIKEINGYKVGIFGLCTPATTYMTHPKNVEGLNFENPVEIAKEMVDELKDKTDFIIALTHLGVEGGKDTSTNIAENVNGIDLIVDGHSHTTLENGKKVNNTWIVQTGDYDKNLGIVNIAVKDGNFEIMPSLFSKEEGMKLSENEEMLKVMDEINAEYEKMTAIKVGKTDVNLDGERANVRTGETSMGNVITNAMLDVTGAEIALTNGGGIRASIEKGEITKADIIKVLPFGNYIVTIEVTGEEVIQAIENGIDEYPKAKGAFPHVAGMNFTFDPSKEAGNKVVEVMINGKAIDVNKTYLLATNDFLAAGGDNYKMFKDNPIKGEFPALDEAVISYISEYGTSNITLEGRAAVKAKSNIYIVKLGDTLSKIGKAFDIPYKKIAEYNNIKNVNFILEGQKLLIPSN